MTKTPDTSKIITQTGDAMSTLNSVAASIVDSYGNGAADLLDTLGGIRLVELAANQARHAVVARARAEGYTWEEIGDTLAITKQAAQQRFGS